MYICSAFNKGICGPPDGCCAFTDRKPIFEDAEGTSARVPGTTGGTYDGKGALV